VALSDDGDSPRATRQGTMLGTARYMAPEQALGEATVDHRADLWSLGVIVYRLLTGKYPFQGTSLVELVLSICQDPITPPSKYVANLPAGIDTFFERAFSRAPEARFHSALQMASSFAAALATVRTGTLPWGTVVPRASAPSAVPDPRPALESRIGDEAADDADRLCASRESLEQTVMNPNALPPATGILPSSYTPSPSQRSTTGAFSRKRWWWASVPAALVVVGAVVVGITGGGPPVSPINARPASSASDASSSVPTPAPAR
jgi:eukaryotic-like serine/threonine-protein kinase